MNTVPKSGKEMAEATNFKDVKLGNSENHAGSTPSSDFDRLEDCNEAEFQGGTLSLSQENSPTTPNTTSVADANANIASNENVVTRGNRRSSSLRMQHRSEVQDFFAIREGALQRAAEECTPVILQNIDGDLRGIWLLTEIDHWDTEKERMLFLTENSLISLKYDFITLRLLDYKRLPLVQFEQIIIGELKYPEKSLMPKINGAMDFVKQRIIPKLRQGKKFQQSPQTNRNPQRLAIVSSQRSARNQLGVRCSWNQTEHIPALKRWNPWSREIPFVTYTSHPLLKTETGSSDNYDIEDFSKKLIDAIEKLPRVPLQQESAESPIIESRFNLVYQPIIIESYAGIAAALHNANELGFFKSRGKVSF